MYKRQINLIVVLALCLLFTTGAFALDYSGSQGNEATFETLQEARESGPAAVADLETNTTKTFISHPVLNGYPEGTTFVYRSANLFGGRAAARLNTNILVFSDQHFEEKDAALAYLKGLGVIDIIDQAVGSVILVTPADPAAGFGQADQKNYYALQTAICAQKASETDADGNVLSYSDAEYFGGYGYLYVIGIDGGASFLNDYIASEFDYVSRIAGMLLINGKMEAIRNVAKFVPVYLVNADASVVDKYIKANNAEAYSEEGNSKTYFNQQFPLQKVIVASDSNPNVANYIKDAYYNMMIKAMRLPIVKQGLYSAGTPYQGYSFDQAPYSLFPRNAAINGVTEDGIYLIRHDEERFSDVQSQTGAYLQTWFEYLPEEVKNGTAPDGTIPLILANHGGGDDPRLYIDENGFLELAGKERVAIVAGEHMAMWMTQGIPGTPSFVMQAEGLGRALCTLVKYMLDTYPALDASRVYVTGYSMGGSATYMSIYEEPTLFAAAAPMASAGAPATDEQSAKFDSVDLPFMITTSGYDFAGMNAAAGTINVRYEETINSFLGFNGLKTIDAFDYAKYPVNGFKADKLVVTTVNGEYKNFDWSFVNADGAPMVKLNFTEGLVHGLYPEYANIFWNYVKCFSRNQETKAIEYNPYVNANMY